MDYQRVNRESRETHKTSNHDENPAFIAFAFEINALLRAREND